MSEEEEEFSDEDISQFSTWTNAGKLVSDLRIKAQEELFKKLQSSDFDEIDCELSPPAKKAKGRKCTLKDRLEGSSVVSPTQEPELSQSREVVESCERVTRSQSRGRGRGRRQGRSTRASLVLDCEDLTGSGDSTPSPVISKLLPRPKIFEDSPINISDEDSEDDVSFSTMLVEEDFNYEVSVKVRWRFKDIHKFKIRKFQKFTSVFEYFSKLENVPEDQVYLTLDDNIIVPTDSPDSLHLTIANIIDGSILVHKPVESITRTHCNSPVSKDSIQLKVCTKDSKEPMLVKLSKTEKMMVLMSKISEEVGKPLDALKFLFDGEPLNPNETPNHLDLEGGELIELRVMSN